MTEWEAAGNSVGAKPAPDYPGYFVTFDGEVYSSKKRNPSQGLRLLRPKTDKFGYLVYGLCVGPNVKTVRGHQIVASAFLPPKPSPLHGIRHKDDDPANNKADNLEWGTQAENIADRNARGRTGKGEKMRRDVPKGSRCQFAVLEEQQVIEIKRRLAGGESGSALGREYGVAKTTISAIKQGKTWAHL